MLMCSVLYCRRHPVSEYGSVGPGTSAVPLPE